MATTTNYSWTTPDDTALVKDGAAAIRSLGSSIDTTTKALNPSTTLGDIEYRSSTANTNTRLGIGSTGQVLTVAGGVPSWATPASGSTFSGVALFRTTNQTLSDGVGTNILFDGESFDTDSFHSTSSNTDRITIPSGKAGKYFLHARIPFSANATGTRIGMIRKNAAATVIARTSLAPGNSTGPECVLEFSTIADLSVADYVVIEAYQDRGGTLDVNGTDVRYVYFSAVYLGA